MPTLWKSLFPQRASSPDCCGGSLPARIRRALRFAASLRVRKEETNLRGMLTVFRVAHSPLSVQPEIVNVELTNRCNQKCAFCPTGTGTNQRPKGDMEFDTFRAIVDGLTPFTRIQFAGYGEPFLHRQLEHFLDYAATKGLNKRLQILTNLAAVDEQRVRRLLDHPFHKMYVSLDAMTSEEFLTYKRVNQFDVVRRNIEILAADAARRTAVSQQLIVQMVLTRKNQHQREEFERYVRGLGMQPKFKSLNTYMSLASKDRIQEFEIPELSRYDSKRGYSKRCPWPWGGFIVYWNGDVSVCCEDPLGTMIYGNVLQSSPVELLNLATGRCGFRQRYFKDPAQIAICRGCSYA